MYEAAKVASVGDHATSTNDENAISRTASRRNLRPRGQNTAALIKPSRQTTAHPTVASTTHLQTAFIVIYY
eukprot:scaffold386029_cov16-Prasinocladus_malaysianus.AAC.1